MNFGGRAPTPRLAPSGWLRRTLVKALSLAVAGVLLGWGYQWAAARLYRAEHTAGFWYGALHGALMPAALPSLVAGKNVPIFATNNSGRPYKLGYIMGINLCGLIFFGLAFRKPGKGADAIRHLA